jgi:DNA-binding beta-propeller fold protein YncE
MSRRAVSLTIALALGGCGGSGDSPDLTRPPTAVDRVEAGDSFDSPMDAVASPDGQTFYFTAHAVPSGEAAVFAVPAAGGAATALYEGEPLADPSGLLLSCDGQTLYIADLGNPGSLEGDRAPVYALEIETGSLRPLLADGIGEAAGLAVGPDCETLYVSGYAPQGTPALFRIPIAGGTAEVVREGEPLESPSGVFVDADEVAWVMDHLPSSLLGGGLFAITPDGAASEVIGGLDIAEPAGVSLVAGGGTAVIPSRDDDGRGQLITVHIESGAMTIVESDMLAPAGIRTARAAAVFAVVDANDDAIYRAQ